MRLTLLALFMSASLSAMAEIISLVGPTATCQSSSNSYTVTYFTVRSQSYYEQITAIQWIFSSNGQVFSTLNSSSFPSRAPISASVSMTAPAFPVGTVRIEVRFTVVVVPFFGLASSTTFSRTLDVSVGPAAPTSLGGPYILFPGGTGTFTTSAVQGAQSYQWEVPPTWTVNGVSGPLVTTTNPSATVALPPCIYDSIQGRTMYPPPASAAIKVRAMSATCGLSAPKSMNVFIDLPVEIYVTSNNDGSVTFEASYGNLLQYNWMRPMPTGWQVLFEDSYRITINMNGISGTVRLRYKSISGCVYGLEKYWEPTQPPPPPPCCDFTQAFPVPASGSLNVRHPTGTSPQLFIDGNSVPYQQPTNGDIQIDISGLSPGPHILQVRDIDGKNRLIRFVKSD